jgi:hypothetical protein
MQQLKSGFLKVSAPPEVIKIVKVARNRLFARASQLNMIFNDFQIKQNRRIQKGFVKTLHSQNT